jgi:predicted GIY-YIG superfamily endonuclease
MYHNNQDVFSWREVVSNEGSRRKKYHLIKGVYALVGGSTILYIGSSDDMRFRFPGHPKIKEAKAMGYTSIRIMQYECANNRTLEIELIKMYSPLLNKEHKPGYVVDRRTKATKAYQLRQTA